MNKRTREQNNNNHVAEKIATLEKEKREMSEKLKKECENVEKLKKVSTEMSVANAAAQSVVGDLNDKIASLAEDRNLLEREIAKLQSQFQLEKNQRMEAKQRLGEVEGTEGRIVIEKGFLSLFTFIFKAALSLCLRRKVS